MGTYFFGYAYDVHHVISGAEIATVYLSVTLGGHLVVVVCGSDCMSRDVSVVDRHLTSLLLLCFPMSTASQ